jgi:hypothetical protein
LLKRFIFLLKRFSFTTKMYSLRSRTTLNADMESIVKRDFLRNSQRLACSDLKTPIAPPTNIRI